jgi:CheY-like chemotaxis protein/HPt (histidine-containing phosphotransfer) domain-containing protein
MKAMAMLRASECAATRLREVPSVKGTTLDCSGIRILVVEDNAVNQQVALGMLEARGYRVDVAANGLEAVTAVTRTPYAAVIMDCQMPEMDGYEAAVEIRKREGAARRTPIIALTAHALAGEREKCVAAGMDDYVAKPVRPDELYAALERWIPNSACQVSEALQAGDVISADPEDSAIDSAALEGIRKLQQPGAPDFLTKLIKTFLQDTPPRLVAVRDVAQRGDGGDLSRLAHVLKGSSASLGARHMAQLCAELERLGHSQDLRNALDLAGRLELEFKRVCAALRGHMVEA